MKDSWPEFSEVSIAIRRLSKPHSSRDASGKTQRFGFHTVNAHRVGNSRRNLIRPKMEMQIQIISLREFPKEIQKNAGDAAVRLTMENIPIEMNVDSTHGFASNAGLQVRASNDHFTRN